jgi:transcriptional regulator with XRE-family HTH domain
MNDFSYTDLAASSDKVLLEKIGAFIKHHRLQQNKTQDQLAREAGIARSTLSLFEKGENTGTLVFIQLLRALKLLHMLHDFQIRQQLSPLQLAKLEQSKRIRASKSDTDKKKPKKESSW